MFFVSCWHMNDVESYAQWKIYGESPFSMAIVSSFSSLSHAILDSKNIYGSIVSYYDPRCDTTPEGNAFYLATYKRNAFIHEKEFRLIYLDHSLLESSDQPPDISISIDLEKMIEKIVLSPLMPEWFVKELKTFIRNNGLPFDCNKSDLLELY